MVQAHFSASLSETDVENQKTTLIIYGVEGTEPILCTLSTPREDNCNDKALSEPEVRAKSWLPEIWGASCP